MAVTFIADPTVGQMAKPIFGFAIFAVGIYPLFSTIAECNVIESGIVSCTP